MASRVESVVVRKSPGATPRRGQHGVVMFVALIVLIVMTLAGLAMLRQMSSGVSIAGNIAFKQSATAVADAGVEAGRAWMGANAPTLGVTQAASGYYATWALTVDPTSTFWADNVWNIAPILPPAVTGNNGNTVRYVIERLCSNTGPTWGPGMLPTQQCADSVGKSVSGQSMGGPSYSGIQQPPPPAPFYRVTTQVTGPRNTVSYTQVVLN